MTLLGQIVVGCCLLAIFGLLQHSYRNSHATEESFLCALLIMVMSAVVPDAVVLLPVVLWGFHLLWADNLRVFLAALVGVLLPLLYASLAAWIWPDAGLVAAVGRVWSDALHRTFCYPGPLPLLIAEAVLFLLTSYLLVVHLYKFTRANVRTQGTILLSIPLLVLSALSCVFPSVGGNSLLVVMVLLLVYLMVQYVVSYGFPKVRIKRRERRSKRNYSRRSMSGYGRKRRWWSRR